MSDYRPQRPSQSVESQLWTYQDAVEYVLDVFDDERSNAKVLRQAKRAVLRAYRDLPNRHDWKCYQSRRILVTAASQDDGTITYDHTGGASERLLTLADDTFPSTARFFRINIDGTHYPIDTYVDSTNVTLPENENPGADVAAGTDCVIYRNAYPLPADFRKMGWLFDITGKNEIEIVSPDEAHAHSVFYGTPGVPSMAAIHEAGEYFGVMQLVFGPAPSTARTYDMLYTRSPRALLTERVEGTATTVGTAVTVDAAVLDSNKHVGSVLRFSDSTTDPTGPEGDIADVDNPYFAQRIIQSVNSTTTATLDAALPSNITDKNYVLSDPIDLHHSSMLTYFQLLCEAIFCRITGREDRHERRAVADRELLLAMEADSRVYPPGNMGGGADIPFHLRHWSTISDEVVNPST